MTPRAAAAAEQSWPQDNAQFRRAWGVPITTAPDSGPMRSWHASDVRPPAMSPARRLAEAAWARIVRRAAP